MAVVGGGVPPLEHTDLGADRERLVGALGGDGRFRGPHLLVHVRVRLQEEEGEEEEGEEE